MNASRKIITDYPTLLEPKVHYVSRRLAQTYLSTVFGCCICYLDTEQLLQSL